MTVPDDFRDLANTLADIAGPIIRGHFRTSLKAEKKSDQTPVTIADRAAEEAMRTAIAQRFPDHGIIGEEFGADKPEADYVWVLDPIDGTKGFLSGKPLFGTLIACVEKGRPILGVIDQPVLKERWVGLSGQATTLNDVPVKTRDRHTLEEAVLYATSPHMFSEDEAVLFHRLRETAGIVQYGADCYAYGLLAAGFVDLVVEAGLKPYDYCALVPVIEGAGGVISDWEGAPLTLRSKGRVLAAGSERLHRSALTILGG